jgi:hypothetical protein
MREMYPWIPWELVADPLGSAEHTVRTSVLNCVYSVSSTSYLHAVRVSCPLFSKILINVLIYA